MIPSVPPATISLQLLPRGRGVCDTIQSQLTWEEVGRLSGEEVTYDISLLHFVTGLVMMCATERSEKIKVTKVRVKPLYDVYTDTN